MLPIQLGGPIDSGKGLDSDTPIPDKEKFPRQDGREKGNLR
jgi:hypothetical protein